MAKSNELVPVGDDSSYAVLRMDPTEVADLLKDNLGGESLSVRDLDRVKVPSGGALSWEVPTIDGVEAMKTIEGVIVNRATVRAYWPNPYDGSNDPPACFSDDGEQGIGDPGGPCLECPFNEFGSGKDNAKACKETRQLFVLSADSLIPIVVTVPPSSLANVKAYFLRLMRAQLSPQSVVTNLTLEKAKSGGGIDYSKVILSAGDRLDPQASARLKEYAAKLEPLFRAAARVERDEAEV